MLFTFPYDRFFFIPFNKQIIIFTVLSLYNCCFFFIFFEWHDYSAVNFPKQRCGLSSVSGCLILLPFGQCFRYPVFQAVPEIVPIARSNLIRDDQKKGWGLKRRPNFSAKLEATRGSPYTPFREGYVIQSLFIWRNFWLDIGVENYVFPFSLFWLILVFDVHDDGECGYQWLSSRLQEYGAWVDNMMTKCSTEGKNICSAKAWFSICRRCGRLLGIYAWCFYFQFVCILGSRWKLISVNWIHPSDRKCNAVIIIIISIITLANFWC